MRVRPQPAGDVHRQHETPVGRPRQRHPGQDGAQPIDVQPPASEGVVQRPVTAAVLTNQRQLHQRPDRPISAQHPVCQV